MSTLSIDQNIATLLVLIFVLVLLCGRMKYKPDDIFTPQGLLKEVEKNPNLDFLMNIFNIPRAFSVSGFGGQWTVGQHSFATALIALFWAKYKKLSDEKRDRLVTLALLHDIHESVTGDILPMFKSGKVRTDLETIQKNILSSLNVEEPQDVKVDLKVIDMVAFLYEVKQVSPNILQPKKLKLARTIAEKQTELLYIYCRENNIAKKTLQTFLKQLDLL